MEKGEKKICLHVNVEAVALKQTKKHMVCTKYKGISMNQNEGVAFSQAFGFVACCKK